MHGSKLFPHFATDDRDDLVSEFVQVNHGVESKIIVTSEDKASGDDFVPGTDAVPQSRAGM